MFFKDITEVKKYVNTNATFNFEILEPKLRDIDRDVLKLHFGNDFIEELQAAYDAVLGVVASLTLAEQKAVEKMRAVSAPLALALHITAGQLQIDNAGIFVVKNENRGIAWEWQINDLQQYYLRPGYQSIEAAILFFQKNIADYATYAASEEFEYSVLCFVPSAKDFTKFYSPLNNSYMSFLKMRSCMDKVDEIEIKAILLPDYYEELKTKLKAGTLQIADKALIPFIKKAIANLTAHKALSELNATFDQNGFMTFDNTSGVKSGASKKTAPDVIVIRAMDSLQKSGETYLKTLKNFLEANKGSYPTYTSDATYTSDESSIFNNVADQGYYSGL